MGKKRRTLSNELNMIFHKLVLTLVFQSSMAEYTAFDFIPFPYLKAILETTPFILSSHPNKLEQFYELDDVFDKQHVKRELSSESPRDLIIRIPRHSFQAIRESGEFFHSLFLGLEKFDELDELDEL